MPTSPAANPATCGRFQRPIGITQTSAYYLQQAETWDAIPAAGPCRLLAELHKQQHR
jgi:hypothetical protein